MKFHERLRKLREEASLTREAVEAQTGIKVRTLINWEKGESEPTISDALALAKLYGATLSGLVGEVSPERYDMITPAQEAYDWITRSRRQEFTIRDFIEALPDLPDHKTRQNAQMIAAWLNDPEAEVEGLRLSAEERKRFWEEYKRRIAERMRESVKK